MELAQRRWAARGIRVGLIVLAIGFVGSWFWRRAPGKELAELRVQSQAPAASALGEGDLQIVSRDNAVDVILKGNQVLAGLSPQSVEKVRGELAASSAKDTQGLGGSIAQMVKNTVAGAVGMHVVYPVAEIRDIRYEDGQIIIEKKVGGETRLFGDTKVNGRQVSKSFREEDVQRFIEAVRARKRQLDAGAGARP